MAKYDYEQIYQQIVKIANSEERLKFLRRVFEDDPDRVSETAEMTIWVAAHKLDRKTCKYLN